MIERPTPLRQRRELGQIVETAFALYTRNFSVLVRIAAVVVPLGVAMGIFQTSITNDAVALGVVGVIGVCQVGVNLLASAALLSAFADIEAGRPPDFARAYDAAFERFWVLLAAVLRVTFHLLLLVLTIVGIPWAVQRAVRWVFVAQAVVLDGAPAKDSLSRSAEAVAGSWWRTLGIWLLVSIAAALPVALVSGAFALAPVAVASTVNAAVDALALPFVVLALTLLYFDLQARKETPVAAGL